MRIDMIAAVGVATALGLTLATGSAMAGDHGCRSSECYERVRQPDVYGHVDRPVVIQPGYSQVVHYPAAVHDRVRAVEVIPGSFDVQRTPAMYGSYTRTVMVAPSRTTHQHVPARYKVAQHEQIVRAAKVRWERQVDAHGRVTMCKVVVPAVTRTVARSVMVSPAHTVAHVAPARYTQVRQPMLVAPARTNYSYNPPVYSYVSEPMVIRPATREVINHPPVIGFQSHKVLVRRGGYGWAPVGHRHW